MFAPVLQERVKGVRAVWQTRRHVNASSLEALRRQAWDMFDHGFSSYMKHAFPKVGQAIVTGFSAAFAAASGTAEQPRLCVCPRPAPANPQYALAAALA